MKWIVILFLPAFLATGLRAEDWPHLWGATLRGSGAVASIEGAAGVEFETLWKRPLGSGYSSLSIAGDKAYTMASQGERDWLIALDRASGAEAFRVDLGERWQGRNGSSDGPLSTPTIDSGAVYALGPHGNLIAVDAASGETRWARNLSTELKAKAPGYGFSTSPLIVDDLLVVQIGNPAPEVAPEDTAEHTPDAAEPGAVVALNRNNGEVVWRSGRGMTEAQVPLLARLGGQLQIVTATAETVFGLAPKTGEILWETVIEPRRRWTTVSLAGDNELVLAGSQGTALFDISKRADGTFAAEQRWDTNVLRGNGQNPRMPIYRDGHLYAHTGRFLSCVRASDGQLAWRSRPPGGDTLIEAGGHLMMVGSDGFLVAVRTGSEGYDETGRTAIFDRERAHTPPSLADGILYLRNRTEAAAVALRPAATEEVTSSTITGSTQFRRWVEEVRAAEDQRSAADDFMQRLTTSPWLDEDWLHFAYRGTLEEMAIQGDVTGFWPAEAMTRIAGTDVWISAFPRNGAERVHYRFQSFEEPLTDPRNPDTVELTDGTFSTWAGPDWTESALLQAARIRGDSALETHKVQVGRWLIELSVSVPAPVGSAPGTAPLVLIPFGDDARRIGLWDRMLPDVYEELGDAARPAVFVFMSLPQGSVYSSGAGWLRNTLADEILPLLKSHYPGSEGAPITVVTQGLGSQNFLRSLSDPTLGIKRIVLQSPQMDRDFRNHHWPDILNGTGDTLNVLATWGNQDGNDPALDLDVARDVQALAAKFEERGASVTVRETLGGFGWIRWREDLPAIVEFVSSSHP